MPDPTVGRFDASRQRLVLAERLAQVCRLLAADDPGHPDKIDLDWACFELRDIAQILGRGKDDV